MSIQGVSYRLDPGAPVAGEVRRVATGLFDAAARAVRRAPAPSVVEVGVAAEAVAEAESLARLIRGGLDGPSRRLVSRRLRVLRDVLGDGSSPPVIDTFEAVAGLATDSIASAALHRLRLALAEQAAHQATARVRGEAPDGHHAEPSADWTTVADDLDAAVLAASLWSLGPEGFAALAPGLERTYRQGQDALAAVDADGEHDPATTARLAARVRDHHHHLRLLRPIWPRVMKPLVRESGALADLVDRQCSMGGVRAALLALDDRQLRRDARALVGVLDEDRAELAVHIVALGTRLYADDPGALVARFSLWWSVAAE